MNPDPKKIHKAVQKLLGGFEARTNVISLRGKIECVEMTVCLWAKDSDQENVTMEDQILESLNELMVDIGKLIENHNGE